MKTSSFAFVLSSLLTSSALAADFAVMPVQGTNLSPGEIEAIGVMLANAYAEETKADVMGPVQVAKVQQGVDPAGGDSALVSALGVKEYIEVHAVQLKTKLTLRAVLRNAEGGIIHTAEMTALSLDDLEQVSERLAKTLVNRTTVAETRTIHNVTKTEGKVPNRTFSEKVMGIKTGVILPVARGLRFQPSMSLSFDGRFETDKGFLEFGIGFVAPTMTSDKEYLAGLFAELGGSYYLINDSISPYVGGGFVPRIYWGMDDGGFRAAVYGQGGVMFLREASTRMYAELRVTQNIMPYSKNRYSYDYETGMESDNNRDYYPTEFSLNIGIGW